MIASTAMFALSPSVIEFLCCIGGPNYIQLLKENEMTTSIGISDGIISLNCPIQIDENIKKKESTIIEINHRIPLVDIVSSTKPETSALEILTSIIDNSNPQFLFVRRTAPSNTPKWVFITWVPEIELQSSFIMFQIAQIRNMILSQLPSVHNVVTSVCCNASEINDLRTILIGRTTNSITESLIDSHASEGFCEIMGELTVPTTSVERLTLLNAFKSLEDYQEQPYLKNLPMKLSNACKDVLTKFGNKEFDVVVLRIDDTTSLVQAENTYQLESPSELMNLFNLKEPKYYLVEWNLKTAFLVHIPEKRVMSLRFLYTLFKTTIKTQVEEYLGIKIHKTVDVRQGESILHVFQDERGIASDIGDQMLLMSEVSVRPRPPVTRMGIDPFLLVKSVPKSEGGIEYKLIRAHERFRF